ncbi:Lrp/AsnC family transcriptional regulator [bacterium]|nr:Lrp/AsnC family transcriptional regulator [bacterium]
MIELTEKERELIRCIQADLPDDKRPFLAIAKKIGWTEDEVMARIIKWMEQGIIKRFGALVRHQNLGFEGNAMVAWSVPEPDVERAGRQMSGYPFISHCYEREIRPGWPYNIYTMIHAANPDEARSLAQEVAKDTGIKDFQILHTVKEWKKKSMEYILEEDQDV